MYYQVFRGDGSSKNYKVLSEMLKDFDRQDVEELYRIVKESLAIHMLTEKKYPLSQEMLSKMLSRKLEVDHESSQAFELLRACFIHKACWHAFLAETYSASVVEMAKAVYFLENHETIVSKTVPLGYHKPRWDVPLMYRKILFTASRWEVFGAS
ncbi:hypothetical protein Tco_0112124 [Tanacetum coccineum]